MMIFGKIIIITRYCYQKVRPTLNAMIARCILYFQVCAECCMCIISLLDRPTTVVKSCISLAVLFWHPTSHVPDSRAIYKRFSRSDISPTSPLIFSVAQKVKNLASEALWSQKGTVRGNLKHTTVVPMICLLFSSRGLKVRNRPQFWTSVALIIRGINVSII